MTIHRIPSMVPYHYISCPMKALANIKNLTLDSKYITHQIFIPNKYFIRSFSYGTSSYHTP